MGFDKFIVVKGLMSCKIKVNVLSWLRLAERHTTSSLKSLAYTGFQRNVLGGKCLIFAII